MAVVAKRYAQALIITAIEDKKVTVFEEQLEVLLNIVSNEKVKDILSFPGINSAKKKELVNGLMKDNFDKNIVNFFMILLDSGRHEQFADIVSEYKKLADEYSNILHVEVISSVELSKDQIDRIKEKIKQKYAADNIEIKTTIDPSVIGGVKLKIGDTVIDGTIKARLESIERVVKQNKA